MALYKHKIQNTLFSSKNIFCLILMMAIGFSYSGLAQSSEQIAITTYYPSPYGIYQQLKLAPSASCPGGDCVNCSDKGLMFYNANTNQISYCDGALWQQFGGGGGSSPWLFTDNVAPQPDYLYTLYSNSLCPNERVGIETQTPQAEFTLESDGGIMAKGTFNDGPNITTVGTNNDASRLIWWPRKAAFRSAYCWGTLCDAGSIGNYSIGFGDALASGANSIGISQSVATASHSISIGWATYATSDYAMAIGNWAGEVARASGAYSLALGYDVEAINPYSMVIGVGSEAAPTGSSFTNFTNDSLIVGFNISSTSGGPVPLLVRGNGTTGNVAIRTTSAAQYGTNALFVNGLAAGTQAWVTVSDERLKKDIKPIPNALDKVMKLRGVNFQWKDPDTYSPGVKMGIIAQEAKDIIPEVVHKNSESYSTEYGPITALLIEAVKEQEKELDSLEEELNIKK